MPVASPDYFEHRLTSLRFCCAANVVTAREAREPDAYRDSSNRLLDGDNQRLLGIPTKSALESPVLVVGNQEPSSKAE